MHSRVLPIFAVILLGSILPTPAANARSKEEYCAGLSARIQSVVDQRDSGKSSYDAVASLVEAFSAEGRAAGVGSDTMINTMVATDMVQRVFRTPKPTAAQAMAEVKARCLLGTAEANQRGMQPTQGSESSTPEAQGHTDRVGFETWIGGLTDDQRRGANFWAAERSKPKPASCSVAAPSPDYTTGCQEAQRRLAPLDVRRKTDPSYRKGWNAPLTEATASADVANVDAAKPGLPAAAASNGSSRPVQGAVETWYVGSVQDRTCFLTTDTFEGARTPEEVVKMFEKARIFYLIRRSENGMVSLHNTRDPNNILPLFKDKEFCEFAMKMMR